MACRNAYQAAKITKEEAEIIRASITELNVAQNAKRLLFGVDTMTPANDLLQNNIDHFEWVVRNKIHPNFYGRNIVGDNPLTKEEILYIHGRGCKIAVKCENRDEKKAEEKGIAYAERIGLEARKLGIPGGCAIFLVIEEDATISHEYMRGFAMQLMIAGYTPGFHANTDAKYAFDREFGRGVQVNREVFKKCLIWATAPIIPEYDGITTSHLIHPDEWKAFAPSCITRREIAIWQYGKNAHPIENDDEQKTSFNLNLVRNEQIIIEKMF